MNNWAILQYPWNNVTASNWYSHVVMHSDIVSSNDDRMEQIKWQTYLSDSDSDLDLIDLLIKF